MAYAPPHVLKRGRSILGLGATLDAGLRKARSAYWSHAVHHPLNPVPRLFLQSVMIIQPIDVLEDGRMNMCDACPDITVHDGELVWSCRLEERKAFGGFAHGIPQSHPETSSPTA
jgi:hypothetical protein